MTNLNSVGCEKGNGDEGREYFLFLCVRDDRSRRQEWLALEWGN